MIPVCRPDRTENKIGKVVVGLYSSREVTKNTNGKTIIICIILSIFIFFVISVSLCENW
jgi:hypothetical protein